jgi:hypothetical protein
MLKDLLMSKEEDQLKDLFDSCYEKALFLSEQTNPQMVASTYLAIAMRIYKTVLSESEYERMIKVIGETEVESFDDSETVH